MPLSPQSIGLSMSHGFAGSYARQPDMIVNTAPLGGAVPVVFGTPLVRGDGGAVIPMGSGNTGNEFIGVAGKEVFSIHAPRVGCDFDKMATKAKLEGFLSTHPGWGATGASS